MKIGIFGGCFNPPHKMHFKIAEELIMKKYLDKVIFVPTGNFYKKKNLIEGGKIWIEFWRKNIEIFVEQYLGIKLHLFQKIVIHMMHKSNYFCWSACRGLGAENVEKSTN